MPVRRANRYFEGFNRIVIWLLALRAHRTPRRNRNTPPCHSFAVTQLWLVLFFSSIAYSDHLPD